MGTRPCLIFTPVPKRGSQECSRTYLHHMKPSMHIMLTSQESVFRTRFSSGMKHEWDTFHDAVTIVLARWKHSLRRRLSSEPSSTHRRFLNRDGSQDMQSSLHFIEMA